MRNLRKTRKRGGLRYTPNIYTCGTKRTASGRLGKVPLTECIRNFASANNFTIVETADDGNCLYDSLSKYGARSGNPKLNKGHMELRREIIGKMIEDQENYEPFFVADRTVSPEATVITVNAGKELRKFLKSREWVGWMGDVIPQVAANILGINITIFNLIIRSPSNEIDRIEITPETGEADTTVNILRTGGNHFRLLWPKLSPAASISNSTVNASLPTKRRTRPKVAPNINIKKNEPTSIVRVTRSRPKVAPNNNTKKKNAMAKKKEEAAIIIAKRKEEEKLIKKKAKELASIKEKEYSLTQKKLNSVSNNEKEALNLQEALLASMKNLKINNGSFSPA